MGIAEVDKENLLARTRKNLLVENQNLPSCYLGGRFWLKKFTCYLLQFQNNFLGHFLVDVAIAGESAGVFDVAGDLGDKVGARDWDLYTCCPRSGLNTLNYNKIWKFQ